MHEKKTTYKISFRVFYRISKDSDQFAQLTFRFMTRFPTGIKFALDPTLFLPYEQFVQKYHDLFITRDEKIMIYLKNGKTKRVKEVELSLNKDWLVPKSWTNKIARAGSVDVTNEINSLLRS
jgi:hypothetical protein